jgi:hypothetical protein
MLKVPVSGSRLFIDGIGRFFQSFLVAGRFFMDHCLSLSPSGGFSKNEPIRLNALAQEESRKRRHWRASRQWHTQKKGE